MKSKNTGHKDRFGSNFLLRSFIEQPPVSIQIHTLNGRLIDAYPDFAKLYSPRDEALKNFMINTTSWKMSKLLDVELCYISNEHSQVKLYIFPNANPMELIL